MAVQTGPIVEERHVIHHDSDDSSASMIAVLLIAAVLIIGFLLFAMRVFPFSATTPAETDASRIDVTIPSTPDVNVNQENNVPPAAGEMNY